MNAVRTLHSELLLEPATAPVGGYLTLKGTYFDAHRKSILEFVALRAAHAHLQCPEQCIIETKLREHSVVVSVSDAPLACRMGIALQDAFRGDLDLDFGRYAKPLHATWSR